MIHYTLIDDQGVILQRMSGPAGLILPPAPSPGQTVLGAEAPVGTDWWTGTEFAARPPQPTPHHIWQSGAWVDPRTADEIARARTEALVAETTSRAQALLDAKARERRWDDLASLRSALGSPNPQWHQEAQDALRWHADVWQQLHTAEGDIRAGRRLMPASADEVLAELPPLRWSDETNPTENP